MTASDGAILFAACALSFALGYAIGAFRVARFVGRRLDEIKGDVGEIQKHSRELRQIYSKLEEGDGGPTQ
jgi:hypothetical protein